MTALTDTTRPAATSRIRPSGYAAIAVAGVLACLSGLVPVLVALI